MENMNSHGIIYQAPGLGKRIVYQLLRGFGAGLIAFAFTGIIFSFWPIIKDQFSYYFGKKENIEISGFGKILANYTMSDVVRAETDSLNLDPYFSVYIPKIGAKSKVIPNVDTSNQDEYLSALQEGVAHAKGTNFPGSGHTIYLFSHSTNSPLFYAEYNAVFYLLRNLEKGDRIVVYFVGRKFTYQVTDKVITGSNDNSWLDPTTPALRGMKDETLILQTCDPPGTSWNRLLIVAKPI